MKFYVDSCIYVNLWNKEGNENYGVPYWKFAERFFEKFDNKKNVIYYSGFVLKELKFTLDTKTFKTKSRLFAKSLNFRKLILSEKEKDIARKLDLDLN